MSTHRRIGRALCLLLAIGLPALGQEESGPDEIPAPYRPFEHLIGGWKGMAVPTADRLRGWPETHRWAWSFQDGQPAGLAIDFDGSKQLVKARLLFDPANDAYRLVGTTPEGTKVEYRGSLDEKGQTLTLDRVETAEEASASGERIILRLNSNAIRYTFRVDRKQPRAVRFSRFLEANLGKEGESFAAAGAEEKLPRCILTGGAASMTVSYGGRSYPVCCSGCRDEFLANPEKYIAKARKQAEKADR